MEDFYFIDECTEMTQEDFDKIVKYFNDKEKETK